MTDTKNQIIENIAERLIEALSTFEGNGKSRFLRREATKT